MELHYIVDLWTDRKRIEVSIVLLRDLLSLIIIENLNNSLSVNGSNIW